MGLTRKQEEAHQCASDLIFGSDKLLKPDEVWFCLENWDPRAANLVSKTQAYFTPMALAMSATMNIAAPGRHILDLCAGTGRLSFALLQNCYWDPEVEITAVEINPDYVAVGKRLLPRAIGQRDCNRSGPGSNVSFSTYSDAGPNRSIFPARFLSSGYTLSVPPQR